MFGPPGLQGFGGPNKPTLETPDGTPLSFERPPAGSAAPAAPAAAATGSKITLTAPDGQPLDLPPAPARKFANSTPNGGDPNANSAAPMHASSSACAACGGGGASAATWGGGGNGSHHNASHMAVSTWGATSEPPPSSAFKLPTPTSEAAISPSAGGGANWGVGGMGGVGGVSPTGVGRDQTWGGGGVPLGGGGGGGWESPGVGGCSSAFPQPGSSPTSLNASPNGLPPGFSPPVSNNGGIGGLGGGGMGGGGLSGGGGMGGGLPGACLPGALPGGVNGGAMPGAMIGGMNANGGGMGGQLPAALVANNPGAQAGLGSGGLGANPMQAQMNSCGLGGGGMGGGMGGAMQMGGAGGMGGGLPGGMQAGGMPNQMAMQQAQMQHNATSLSRGMQMSMANAQAQQMRQVNQMPGYAPQGAPQQGFQPANLAPPALNQMANSQMGANAQMAAAANNQMPNPNSCNLPHIPALANFGAGGGVGNAPDVGGSQMSAQSYQAQPQQGGGKGYTRGRQAQGYYGAQDNGAAGGEPTSLSAGLAAAAAAAAAQVATGPVMPGYNNRSSYNSESGQGGAWPAGAPEGREGYDGKQEERLSGGSDGREAPELPTRGGGKGYGGKGGEAPEYGKGARIGKGGGKGGKGGKGGPVGFDQTSTYRVRLHKPEASSRLGITLVNSGDAPCISALAPGCIGALSGMVSAGQKVFAVNGVPVSEHESATQLLRSSVGTLELTVSRSDQFGPSSPPKDKEGGDANNALQEELRKLREENKKLKEESAAQAAADVKPAKGSGRGKGVSDVSLAAGGRGAAKGQKGLKGEADPRTEWQEWLRIADVTAQEEMRRRGGSEPAKTASAAPVAAAPIVPAKGGGRGSGKGVTTTPLTVQTSAEPVGKGAKGAKGAKGGRGLGITAAEPPAGPPPPSTTVTVKVHKPDKTARLGITLRGKEGSAPTILAIAPGCIADKSGVVTIGQLLFAVNGQVVEGHEQGTQLLRAASGDVRLTLSSVAYPISQPSSPSMTSSTPPFSPNEKSSSAPSATAVSGKGAAREAAAAARAEAKAAREAAAKEARAKRAEERAKQQAARKAAAQSAQAAAAAEEDEEELPDEEEVDNLVEMMLRKEDEWEEVAGGGASLHSAQPGKASLTLDVSSDEDVRIEILPTSSSSVRLRTTLFGVLLPGPGSPGR